MEPCTIRGELMLTEILLQVSADVSPQALIWVKTLQQSAFQFRHRVG